jgi:hypothetical protein
MFGLAITAATMAVFSARIMPATGSLFTMAATPSKSDSNSQE